MDVEEYDVIFTGLQLAYSKVHCECGIECFGSVEYSCVLKP